MIRLILTAMFGMMLLLAGGMAALAKGNVIWQGTQEGKISFFGKPKTIKITTEGVFIDGTFKDAWKLSKNDACLYGISNFPNSGYFNTSKTWAAALQKFDFAECRSIRLQAKHSFNFQQTVSSPTKAAGDAVSAQRVPNLAEYDEFRLLEYTVGGQTYVSHTAFIQSMTALGFRAKGVLAYRNEVCDWQSTIRSNSTNTGSFTATCPSGTRVDGKFTFVGNKQGSYGSGVDDAGRPVSYRLQGSGSSTRARTKAFFETVVGGSGLAVAARDDNRKTGGLYANRSDANVCQNVTVSNLARAEANRRGLNCRVQGNRHDGVFAYLSDDKICDYATMVPLKTGGMSVGEAFTAAKSVWSEATTYVEEAKRRGLSCGVTGEGVTQIAATANAKSAELIAARNRAQQLEQEVAALKSRQQALTADAKAPVITIIDSATNQRKGTVKGVASDNVQIAEILVNGAAVGFGPDGSFEWSGFVPATGKEILIEVIDMAGLSSTRTVRLERGQIQQATGPRFDDLDPTAGRQVMRNDNALALIIGVSDYERTDAPAIYADKDAQYFHDYASLKLGIPDSNIKTLVNKTAEQADVILAVKDWVRRSSKPGETDIYVFFAGHGLASQDGAQMYLLPFDGRPRLLDDTAISRDRLFNDIAAANPRSVVVFLDTCYSGSTRGQDMLIAARPIAIRAKSHSVPKGFTVMTAAAGDQTAKPLQEAQHGMFSYFLMKGMEGDADADGDNRITAGELHGYVQRNVIQQSSGRQTPELQGDPDRVLVSFR